MGGRTEQADKSLLCYQTTHCCQQQVQKRSQSKLRIGRTEFQTVKSSADRAPMQRRNLSLMNTVEPGAVSLFY